MTEMNPVPGTKVNDEAVSAKTGMRWISAIWATLIITIIIGGVWFFKTQVVESEKAALDTLVSIAKLKVNSIVDWRSERMADARVFTGSLYLIQKIQEWMANPTAEDTDNIVNRFRLMQEGYGYYNILLVDTTGNTLVNARLPGTRESLPKEALSAMESAVRDHEAVMTGLYIDPVSGKRRLDIVAPFYVHIAGRDKLIAVAVLTRDPEIFLYPMIQMWPISSKTAETLLVRREGNSVLVLNNVRFKPDSALKMKLNFTQTNHPTVQAILGRRGIFRGVDYRGKRVVAFLTDVQDSPWLMVSKIDADEIFEGIRFRLFSFFVLIAVLLAGALISTHAMRQRVLYFKTLHEKDEAVHSYASRLKEVNKELEAFSYSVSHDLRAPLRGRDGFSKALLDDYSDKLDDTGKGYLNRVRAATKNMSELIDDMLELSRISRKDIVFKTVNLDRIADEIMAGLKEHEPERQVDFSVQAGLTAWGDAHLFEIALQNLLGNAWKFTGKQRSAKIEFGRMKFEGQDAYFIRDDGVGFDAAYYDKLFNPFQRLHSEKEFPGTGIGLVTVRRIVERHGGRVWAESKAGKGATFYFTLNEKKEAL